MITSYTHSQTVAASTWTVVHNAAAKVVSDVWIDNNGAREKVLPESIVHLDDNTLQVNFSAVQTGAVRVILLTEYVGGVSWIPDDITPEVSVLTLRTESNVPLQGDPGGQYLDVDEAAPAPPPAPAVFRDTFTGTDGTLISAHTPDTSTAGAYTGTSLISGNKLVVGGVAESSTSGTYTFTSQLNVTFPYTVTAVMASSPGNGTDIAGYSSRFRLSSNTGAFDYIDAILDANILYVGVQHNDFAEQEISVTPGEHTISIYIEALRYTVSVDGLPSTPVLMLPWDTANGSPNSFKVLLLTNERNYDGVGGETSISSFELVQS
jgi:hypothetical protein